MSPFLSRPMLLTLRHFVLLSLSILLPKVSSQVPGAVYTVSGYDNVNGEDAICWSAPAFHNHTAVEESLGSEHNHTEDEQDEHHLETESFDGFNWNSQLVPSFVAGPTTMLPSCPVGTSVHVDIIPESAYGSWRLRTKRLYTYHVTGTVDLAAIRQAFDLSESSFFFSSDGQHGIGLRIAFCPNSGNLCSPFVLEESVLDSHMHDDSHVHGEEHKDEDNHSDEHGGEEHHDEDDDHNHRGLRRKRVLYSSRARATQILAFNVTFDDPEEDHDEGTNHAADDLHEEDNGEGEDLHDEDHEEGEDDGHQDEDGHDHDEGVHDDEHGEEHHSDAEDGEHDHTDDHEGHSP